MLVPFGVFCVALSCFVRLLVLVGFRLFCLGLVWLVLLSSLVVVLGRVGLVRFVLC